MSKFLIAIVVLGITGCTNIEQKKMSSIELSSGKTVKCKAISKTEYKDILDHAKEKHEVFVREGIKVMQLSENQVLVESNGYYTLYFSLSDLKSVLDDAYGSADSFELMLNKNPFNEQFPVHTNELVKKLFDDLKVAEQPLSRLSLLLIDQKISSLGKGSKDFVKEHFIHILAAIGNLLQQDYQGKWKMELASDGKTWNPYMEVKQHKIEFFTYLYEDVFVNERIDGLLIELYDTEAAIIQNNLK